MASYSIGITVDNNDGGEFYNNLTREQLETYISQKKELIYLISKERTDVEHPIPIVLYTSEVKMKPEAYIENYTDIYGNVLNDFDIYVIKLFN
jgi:hypothetical protein